MTINYTDSEIQNAMIIASCCAADYGFRYIQAEMLGRKTKVCTYSKALYLNKVTCVLKRHLAKEEEDRIISAESITIIIQTINSVCGCNCCKDSTDIFKDISANY